VRMRSALLAITLSLSLPVARAADPAPVAVAPAGAPPSGAAAAAPGLGVKSDLRAEYLAGDLIFVQLNLKNGSTAAISAPDIAQRPWLVDFELGMPGGNRQHRRTTAPAQDAGQTISLRPKGERSTLLEIPLSDTLKPGTYTLRMTVDLGAGRSAAIGPETIVVAAARPVHADLRSQRDPRGPGPILWVHQAARGFDVYLHDSPTVAAPEAGRSAWLLHSDAAILPVLSRTKAGGGGSQHLLWTTGDRSIHFARIDDQRIRGSVGRIETPWPKVELRGEPATDSAGVLHVPLWIPAPKGSGGELRLLSVDDRGRPAFRRMALLTAPPLELSTTVDDSGAVHVLVRQATLLDLYTASPGLDDKSRTEALPVPGRRIASAEAGETWLTARFGLIADSGEQAGGLMVLLLSTAGGQLQPRWLGLRGSVNRTPAPVPWPEGQTLLELLVGATDLPGLLVRGPDGRTAWLEGGTTPVRLPEGRWALARSADNTALIRNVVNGGPVKVTPLVSRP
jgi:hypothetical protein